MKSAAEETPKKKPRAKVAHTYGVNDIMRWKFEENTMPEPWGTHLGMLPKRFTMYVDGDPGNGKTEYQLQLAKVLALNYGKVRVNNVEQGKHVQIQQSVRRNELDKIKAGKFAYCSINNYEKYKQQLRRPNSGRVQIIDSISFFPLSEKQIQELFEEFINKSFVLVAYKAHYGKNTEIRHLCDLKLRIANFIAKFDGANRFGGDQDYVIWDRKKAGAQLSLIEEPNSRAQKVFNDVVTMVKGGSDE